MKYVLVDNQDVVMHISDTINYQENGNVLVDNDSLAYAKILVKKVHEVEEVPSEVVPYKYCYTEEDGFTANPNYVEPEPSQLDRMEQEINNIKTSIEDYNTYKTAYNELTDASDASPVTLRANIQEVLMKSASDTAIVNVEPFIDEYVDGTMEVPVTYHDGDIRKYKGQVYECIKEYTHHGEPDRTPDKEKSLWMIKHTKDKSNPKPFIQPTMAEDSYMKDECCLFELDGVMKLCISKVDNNPYSPADYALNWTIEDWTENNG